MKILIFATMLTGLTAIGSAHAGEGCNVPEAEWQPQSALETKLKADGWEVRSIKVEDGCYEAYAIDAEGNKIEANFDPKSLMRVDTGDADSEDEG